jgi:hypothetical protein
MVDLCILHTLLARFEDSVSVCACLRGDVVFLECLICVKDRGGNDSLTGMNQSGYPRAHEGIFPPHGLPLLLRLYAQEPAVRCLPELIFPKT